MAEHKTGRRKVVKVLGGLIVAGTGVTLSRVSDARKRTPSRGAVQRAPAVRAAAPGTLKPLGPGGTAPPPSAVNVAGPLPEMPVLETQRKELAQLLLPLEKGSFIGGAAVVGMAGVRLGAASVTLKTRGGWTFQVDICQKGAGRNAFPPVASTDQYDLFVANNGQGIKPTDAQLGRMVRALAKVIRANEPKTPSLAVLSLRERLQRYPRGKFSARP